MFLASRRDLAYIRNIRRQLNRNRYILRNALHNTSNFGSIGCDTSKRPSELILNIRTAYIHFNNIRADLGHLTCYVLKISDRSGNDISNQWHSFTLRLRILPLKVFAKLFTGFINTAIRQADSVNIKMLTAHHRRILMSLMTLKPNGLGSHATSTYLGNILKRVPNNTQNP